MTITPPTTHTKIDTVAWGIPISNQVNANTTAIAANTAALGNVVHLTGAETITGAKTFGAPGDVDKLKIAGTTSGSVNLQAQAAASGTLVLPNGTDVLVAASAAQGLSNKTILKTINAQTGTTYTFVLADAAALCTFTNAAAITVTVPPNSSVGFNVGCSIDLAQLGAGKVTVAAGAGVTVNGTPSLGFRAQYSGASLYKLATDTWLLVGDLA